MPTTDGATSADWLLAASGALPDSADRAPVIAADSADRGPGLTADSADRTPETDPDEADRARDPDVLDSADRSPARRLKWWREVIIIAVFYGAYSAVRDIHGKRPVSVTAARTNALRIVHAERWLHVFGEQRIQAAFLHDRWLIGLMDDYYGTVHFVAVVAVLLVLFFRFPERYPRWRNTLALTTGLALVGFLLFPVMPPRLLPSSYHFVDTLQTVGGIWNFKSGAVNSVSNQFAAMPSLHTAWSTWCALAIMPLVRPRWGKVALLGYPLLTVFCIVVTGNHYFADAAGGLVTLAVAYGLARMLSARATQWRVRRMLRRDLLPG